jgi:flagellar biosynthesis/type III secretory pathway protein FliH
MTGSPEATRAAPLFPLDAAPRRRRRIARQELEAAVDAERTLESARAEAEALRGRAEEEGARAAAEFLRSARERSDAESAARRLAVRAEEAAHLERATERILALSVVLAERLLGAALEVDRARIVDIARGAIAEARGARRLVLDAHPLDAETLRRQVGDAGLAVHAVEVRDDETLARGDLRLHTDGGTIDAKLSLRLERLAVALRDAFPGQALLAG